MPRLQTLCTQAMILQKFPGEEEAEICQQAEAYLQLEVDDVPKRLLTINTHRGLYRFNRLPFGVKPASGIFQQCLDALIAGIDGTTAYLDDILRIQGLRTPHSARQMCSLQTEITFLGFIINAQSPGKTKAIQKMPASKDVSQLSSFLGLINFYGNFVKDLHNLRAPLDTLTKEDVVYT
ncbi:hypothetical protein RB195_023524 [Necator americanus]|uniref:Reverse transcriptase domain-containing protein n=1 Tax=Necator americanus TaxID=51031 RepID=A0ABR1EJL9_NECAM